MTEFVPKKGKLITEEFVPQRGRLVTEQKTKVPYSTILSTIGDVAGGDVGPLSAGLSTAGAFAGNIIEDISQGRPINIKKAGIEGAKSGAVSAVTPTVLKAGANLLKPVVKPVASAVGKLTKPVVETLGKGAEFVGEQFIKTASPVIQSTTQKGLKKGFNVYDELIKRRIPAMDRETAVKYVGEGISRAETAIKSAIEDAGDPIVAKSKDIKDMILKLADQAVEETDKKSILNLIKGIDLPKNIKASEALEIKRQLYSKGVNPTTFTAKARVKVAETVNTALKKVEGAKNGLREQEILLTLKPAVERLRAIKESKGLSFNIQQPVRSVVKLFGEEPVSGTGQLLAEFGKSVQKGTKSMSEGTKQKMIDRLNALQRLLRQPAKDISTENNQGNN